MKFSFKIQQYQTDAVDAVARVFQGQPPTMQACRTCGIWETCLHSRSS